MTAVTARNELTSLPVVTGLARPAAAAAHVAVFASAGAPAYSECTCPHDCERDHENE